MENIENIKNTPSFSLDETNKIQSDLIIKSHIRPEEWIGENGRRFRELIDSHPEFADEYRKNPKIFKEFIFKELEKGKQTSH